MSVCIDQVNYVKNNYEKNQLSQSLFVSDDTSPDQVNYKKWNLSGKVFNQVHVWVSRSRQRKILASLDERMLADIGYTKAQARKESNKFFWE